MSHQLVDPILVWILRWKSAGFRGALLTLKCHLLRFKFSVAFGSLKCKDGPISIRRGRCTQWNPKILDMKKAVWYSLTQADQVWKAFYIANQVCDLWQVTSCFSTYKMIIIISISKCYYEDCMKLTQTPDIFVCSANGYFSIGLSQRSMAHLSPEK
jgi:hypothetical protein